ncbi:hypothetical protein ACFW34_12050 [Streptomyces sp. NPDC058848]|uniref:hypothetical protein n=1 Tax=unclassified Streptomyces TaxID=2593676 RepID=UPI0036C7545F
MTLDEALKNAARCLEKAEGAPEVVANTLNTTAQSWLRMADILLVREAPIR